MIFYDAAQNIEGINGVLIYWRLTAFFNTHTLSSHHTKSGSINQSKKKEEAHHNNIYIYIFFTYVPVRLFLVSVDAIIIITYLSFYYLLYYKKEKSTRYAKDTVDYMLLSCFSQDSYCRRLLSYFGSLHSTLSHTRTHLLFYQSVNNNIIF